MLKACLPCGKPQPVMTSSTSAGSRPGLRSRSWSMVKAAVSSGRSEASDPLKARPIGVRTASTITASGIGRLPVGVGESLADCLLGRHPQRAVETDRLAVEHPVLGDRDGKLGVL